MHRSLTRSTTLLGADFAIVASNVRLTGVVVPVTPPPSPGDASATAGESTTGFELGAILKYWSLNPPSANAAAVERASTPAWPVRRSKRIGSSYCSKLLHAVRSCPKYVRALKLGARAMVWHAITSTRSRFRLPKKWAMPLAVRKSAGRYPPSSGSGAPFSNEAWSPSRMGAVVVTTIGPANQSSLYPCATYFRRAASPASIVGYHSTCTIGWSMLEQASSLVIAPAGRAGSS